MRLRYASLFTRAKEAKLPYLRKGNPVSSSLGFYLNPPAFFYTNPQFVLLILVPHFGLLSLSGKGMLGVEGEHNFNN